METSGQLRPASLFQLNIGLSSNGIWHLLKTESTLCGITKASLVDQYTSYNMKESYDSWVKKLQGCERCNQIAKGISPIPQENETNGTTASEGNGNPEHGWQEVTYTYRSDSALYSVGFPSGYTCPISSNSYAELTPESRARLAQVANTPEARVRGHFGDSICFNALVTELSHSRAERSRLSRQGYNYVSVPRTTFGRTSDNFWG